MAETIDSRAAPTMPPDADTIQQPPTIISVDDVISMYPGMFENIPSDDELRSAYLFGATAAITTRLNPQPLPTKFTDMKLPTLINNDLTTDRMPGVASSIVELVRKRDADLVVAADRGGRMLGLTVFGLWNRRYPNFRFPTIDARLNFARISRSASLSLTEREVGRLLCASGVKAEMAQRAYEHDDRPLEVVALDDWICGGGTMRLLRNLLMKSGIDEDRLSFSVGTMSGDHFRDYGKRHVVGAKDRPYSPVWSDCSEILGVSYPPTCSCADCIKAYGDLSEPIRVIRDEAPRQLRKELHEALDKQAIPSPEIPVAQARVIIGGTRGTLDELSGENRLYAKATPQRRHLFAKLEQLLRR